MKFWILYKANEYKQIYYCEMVHYGQSLHRSKLRKSKSKEIKVHKVAPMLAPTPS